MSLSIVFGMPMTAISEPRRDTSSAIACAPRSVPSPVPGVHFEDEDDRLLYHASERELRAAMDASGAPPAFELAGPREKIYFDPKKTACGIVTCGGLCPGLNDVIRAIVMGLHWHYGVSTILGFRYGYEGLSSKHNHEPMRLTPEIVDGIHEKGGTILGSSRGPQDVGDMVDTLERRGVSILFAIGGDGTLRGAQAIVDEASRRGSDIAVIGIPKTIDNDIQCVEKSVGFETAGSVAREVAYAAHSEARGARNGIGLVKLMGRESGFIAAYAALSNCDVDFCLVPEVPFTLEGRGHAVVLVAEGAGQDLMAATGARDASGNVRLGDIGLFLREEIQKHFREIGMESSLKYIDPSYTIRSQPANAHDSIVCLMLGQNAVHAGMAGRTGMLVGHWHAHCTHVPIPCATSERKRIDPDEWVWRSVIQCTGQPARM